MNIQPNVGFMHVLRCSLVCRSVPHTRSDVLCRRLIFSSSMIPVKIRRLGGCSERLRVAGHIASCETIYPSFYCFTRYPNRLCMMFVCTYNYRHWAGRGVGYCQTSDFWGLGSKIESLSSGYVRRNFVKPYFPLRMFPK